VHQIFSCQLFWSEVVRDYQCMSTLSRQVVSHYITIQFF
jgi:hypothetical protein